MAPHAVKTPPPVFCVDTSRLVAPENLFSNLQQPALSAQPCCLALVVPDSWCILALDTIIPDHPGVLSNILALNLESCLGLLGLQKEVVVAVRAVLVALVELFHIFAKDLSALFACENHLGRAFELMVLLLSVAFCAVEPLPAAGRADGDLGVEDVFAGDGISQAHGITGESWKLPHVTERVNVYAPPDRCAVLCFRVSSSQRFRAWRVGEVNKD
jgi:hypothetical protein